MSKKSSKFAAVFKSCNMKKYFVIAFLALGMAAMAQHVTPVTIEIAEVKIDSLRDLYLSEPPMYRASLNIVDQALNRNEEEIKIAKSEVKAEQAHAKELSNALEEATKMTAALKKLYGKEEDELKSMQKVVEKQQKTVARQKDLNKENRDTYLIFLEKQQKELGYSLREVSDRLHAVAGLETTIQNHQTNLQSFVHEIEQKSLTLTQLEATLKARKAQLKAEIKTANTMK